MKKSPVRSVLLMSIMVLSMTISISAFCLNVNAGTTESTAVEKYGGDEDFDIGEGEPSNFDSIETTSSAIDSAMLEQIRRAILYGPASEEAEGKTAASAPETSAEYSTGRIHVKMKPGTRLEKADGVSSLCDAAGKSIDAEVLHWCYQYIE